MRPLVGLKPIAHPELGIESFPSFLRRLAAIYGLSLYQLLRYLCESREISDLVGEAPFRSRVCKPRVLSGYAASIRVLTRRAEAATGVSCIAATTLQRIGPALSSVGAGAITPQRRYCMWCLRDDKYLVDGFAWEPLAWALPTLTCCPVHDAPLHFAASDWGDLGITCTTTREPLISQERRSSLEPWLRAETLKLMAFCAAEPNKLVPHGASRLFLSTYIRHRHLTPADFCQLTALDRANIDKQMGSKVGVTLKTVFVIAQRLALSPTDILAEPIETAKRDSLLSIADHGDEIDALHGKHPRQSTQVYKKLLADIRGLLASKKRLPPLKAVCHAHRVSTGFVRHRMPIEATEFNARRRRELISSVIGAEGKPSVLLEEQSSRLQIKQI